MYRHADEKLSGGSTIPFQFPGPPTISRKTLKKPYLSSKFPKNRTLTAFHKPLYLPEIVEFSTLFIITAFLPKNCHKSFCVDIWSGERSVFTLVTSYN
jgi:hypothetical protein